MNASGAPKGTAQDRPTIHDVARRANVSPATVSKVLRGIGSARPENIARIKDAVRELGFRVDPLAANLRKAQRAIIGLVVPDFQNPLFGALVSEFEQLAAADGYRLVAVSSAETSEREEAQIEALLDWRVAGLIVIPTDGVLAHATTIEEQGVATVLLDRVPADCPFDSVGVDNFAASATVVRHLIGLGHRHILVASSSLTRSNMQDRMRGAMAAAEAAGAAGVIEVLACGVDLPSALQAVAGRLDTGAMPSAIFTLFSPATLATLREVGRRGLVIPDDLSLVGFDDVEWLQVTHPPVAAVVQPVIELARTTWGQMMRRLRKETRDKAHFEVPCRVDFRGSVAAPRSARKG
jgi:LacI family transcriptional regulator